MSFSERLVELRKSRGLTQKQVYEGVSMSMLGYQRYEYGEREPSFQKLIALAASCAVKIARSIIRSPFCSIFCLLTVNPLCGILDLQIVFDSPGCRRAFLLLLNLFW